MENLHLQLNQFVWPPWPWRTQTERLIVQRYLVVLEAGRGHLSGFVPDVPGCSAIAHSAVELRENLYDALEFHIEDLALKGKPLPVPTMGLDDVPQGVVAEWMTVRIRLGSRIDPFAMVRACPGR